MAQNDAVDAKTLRAWWFRKQGLPSVMEGATPAQVLEKIGWARSVGGANPYLTLFSRAGVSKSDAEKAVANLEIHELPSARGCTYVLPSSDFTLALSLSMAMPEGDIQTAKKWLGVTEEEIERLCDKVLAAFGGAPMDPSALRDAVGDAARSLGPEGKKRGVTTTLPLALGRLQNRGEIRRVPVNGRLDQQRYSYVRWDNGPLKAPIPPEEAFIEMARKYFRWIGPASAANFQWFSGLGVKAAKTAMEPLGLLPIEEDSNLLIFPDELEELRSFRAPEEPQHALVASIDSFLLHRRDLTQLIEPNDLQVREASSVYESGHLVDLTSHGILDRGRIVGLWEYDTFANEIVWQPWVRPDDAMRKAVARMETFVRDQLGDARSFSLDSPESRKPKIESLRKAPQPV